MHPTRFFAGLAAAVLLGLPAWSLLAQEPRPYAHRLDVPKLSALGRALFFDQALSASGNVSCASCHDPAHAYGPPNDRAVQASGALPRTGKREGLRSVPSLRYLHSLPPFSSHFFDNDGDDSVDKGPTGGHMWDGRAASGHEQALLPLLSPTEMGNENVSAFARRLRGSSHVQELRDAFGPEVMRDDDAMIHGAALALEVFQETPTEFYPYSSRYDAYLRGKPSLSPRELRGLALFNDSTKGNCASCHVSEPTADGAFPLFTDWGHIALGVPRNSEIVANADPGFFDLGLCGPMRTDLTDQAEDCGRFRTPTLRNVALRKRFFHNGAMHSLEDVVRFYAQRDTDPGRWYHGASKPDDLPSRYFTNLNQDPPFGRHPGDTPALDDAEIADLVAFLGTLTDADLADAPAAPAARRDNATAPPPP